MAGLLGNLVAVLPWNILAVFLGYLLTRLLWERHGRSPWEPGGSSSLEHPCSFPWALVDKTPLGPVYRTSWALRDKILGYRVALLLITMARAFLLICCRAFLLIGSRALLFVRGGALLLISN